MRRIRLVAIDLDGTLLNPQEHISLRNREAVARTLQAGIEVVIVTARSFPRARVFAQELGLRLPVLCCSGAIVADSDTGEVLIHIPVPPAHAVPIVRFGLDHGVMILANRNGEYLAHPDTIARHAALASIIAPHWVPEPRLVDVAAEGPTFLRVMGRDDIDTIRATFEQASASTLRFIEMAWRGVPDLAIYDRRVSKGNALRDFCASQLIHLDSVMAIGDHASDLAMFEAAGVKVAMGNADPELKAAADLITTTNAEDGVADVLERLVLDGEGVRG